MRNLKRVLSLALASVMLLGMMVIGASATNFADDSDIVYKEAVEITAGLGLFAGSDGKFMPQGTVTRAQMATIIVKMLYGSEINADQYKGVGTFSDTAAFEGGWAEGYINLCANLKVVAGYPDGTFKPGNQVTTAEAVTMIINALGVDAGVGSWPLTVMSKAEEMELFADLSPKPGTNVALTRDQLAAIVLPGLEYSPAGATGYKLTTSSGKEVVFDSYKDAYATAVEMYKGTAIDPESKVSEVIGDDALATKVFEMKKETGMVTANQATDADADYTTIDGSNYNIETGLDMIGHYVTVYYKDLYKSEKEPGTAYAIVDECDTYVVDSTITAKASDFKAVFGTTNLTTTGAVNTFDGNYNQTAVAYTYDYSAKSASAGTYVAYEGKLYSYLAPAAMMATKVQSIVTTAGKESINVLGFGTLQNNVDKDEVNEYEGIAKDDYVIAVKAGNIVTLTKTTAVEGKISRTNVKDSKNFVTINGTAYGKFDDYGTTYTVNGALNVAVPTNFDSTYKFYVTEDGKYVHYETVSGQADLSNIVYVNYAYVNANTDDGYGNTIANVYAQVIDMDGKVESKLLASYKQSGTTYVAYESGTGYTSVLPATNALGLTFNTTAATVSGLVKGFYTFEKAENSKLANLGIVEAKAVPAAYNANTAPIYAQATTAATAIDSKTASLRTGDGNAYLTDSTKFVVFDSSATGASATATVKTGRLADTIPAGAQVLLSRNSSGNRLLEVVIFDNDPEAVTNADYIYIPAGASAGKSSDGQLYDVYNSNGELIRITADGVIASTGFHTFAIDSDGKYTNVNKLTTKVTYSDEFETVFNGKIDTTSNIIDEFDVTNAILVDIRDDDDIDDSEFAAYKITTIDELVSLMSDSNNQPAIVLDTYYGIASDKVVEIIFIKAVQSRVTSVTLDKTALTLSVSATGSNPASFDLTETVNPAAATNIDTNVTWKTSDASVATVDSNGNVTAVAPGTATITVTTNSGNKTATCAVTVVA